MNRKVALVLTLMIVAGVPAGYIVVKNKHSHPPVTKVLRITVLPADKLDYVAGKADTPYFKYLMSKKSGIRPGLAQRLEIKLVPGSSVLEAKIGVMTDEEGKRYADGFVATLQEICGK